LTAIDWIIVVLLGVAVLGGMLQGFVRAVFTAGGLLAGIVLAAWNYQNLGDLLTRTLHDAQLSNAIGFVVIACVVMALGALLGGFLSRILHKMGLGCVDRIAGGFFGFLEGAVLVAGCILVTVAFYPKAQWLTESRLPRYFFNACHLSTHVSPDGLAAKVQAELKTLEAASPDWLHQGNPAP
jgi:membrane protein required for colicin V production